jgi:hypothetical protein
VKPRRTQVDPEFDLAVNVPRLGALRSHVERREWEPASQILGDIGVHDEDQMAVAASVVARIPGVETFLGDVVRAEPGNVGARVLRAYRWIIIGWEVRSGLRAEQVSDAQFAEFHQHLRAAETELIELCAIVPWMGLPWTLRLMTARGLELGVSESRRRYDRLAAHHPHHFSGQQQHLQTLCPKWFGTWELALQFARESARDAAPGAPSHALVAITHLERGAGQPDSYFRDDSVRNEICQAAERSVLDPAFGTNLHGVELHSLFAIVQTLAGENARAQRHFAALGTAASKHWFGYLGDPVASYRKLRDGAMGRGRR